MSGIFDRMLDQARAYEPLDGYAAMPLAGPGRWAEIVNGITLYTNDDDVFFYKFGTYNSTVGLLGDIRHKAFAAGESTTDLFDRLTDGYEVVSGDLSELA